MKEIKYLYDRANKYLESSELLIQSGDYESAVSRTYYAMFFIVEALLLTKEITYSSHKGVISGFGEHFVKSGIFSREMSKTLSKAFSKRQIGDYEMTFSIQKQEAEELLQEGREFINSIVNYLEKE